MQRNQKQLMIKITALIGIILIAGALWFYGKQYRTQAYQNLQYGFSLKYPVDWTAEENKNQAAVILYSPAENEADYFKESVNVVVQDMSTNPTDLQTYTLKAIEQMEAVFGENLITVVSQSDTLANRPAYRYVFVGKGPESDVKYMSMWLLKGHLAYQVTYTSLESQYDRYISKVKRIFRSFRVD